MKGPARRKCLCCKEFYRPDHRNLRHQRYCPKPACRKESKGQSQFRWLQRPENQNYFRGPENSRRAFFSVDMLIRQQSEIALLTMPHWG
jgi:hypothetical protein